MTNRLIELKAEAIEAVDKVWFVQAIAEIERTDITLSLRLSIRHDLFVQVFCGAKSDTLYMALIEGRRRMFGIDCDNGAWHIHPYEAVEKHEPLREGLEPKPLLKFLAQVEHLLLEKEIL